jgi:hypothetical protein
VADVQKSAEQVEQKSVRKTPEAAAVSGVIGGQSNQEIHGQANAVAHANDKTLSEPDLIAMEEGETVAQYKARVAQIQANRFGFFDSAGEAKESTQVLIAQAPSSTERGPIEDAAEQLQKLPGDIVNGVWNAAVGTAEAINRHFSTVHIPQGATMDYLSGLIKDPEKYEQYFQKNALNSSACDAAYKAFGLDQLGVDKNLVAGLIWNEQLHRKPTDGAQDMAVWAGRKLEGDKSIGPAQMQIRNIDALVEKYPGLKQLGDPLKAALDPAKAPFFVAAYLANQAESIDAYNKQHSTSAGFTNIPINADTLAYRYNPDVYRDNGTFRSLEPWEKLAIKAGVLHGVVQQEWPVAGVVESSHHVRKVRDAMEDVKTHR